MQKRTPAEVLRLVQDEGIEIVDVRFVDLPGLMQHFSVPAHAADRGRLRRGLRVRRILDPGIPGDPGVGHAAHARPQHRGDRPLPRAPHAERQLLRARPGDPRALLARPSLRRHEGRGLPRRPPGLADTCYFGPEAEFFIFDDVRYSQDQRHAFYQVDSVEGHWNSGSDEGPNLGYKIRPKEGYFPVPPADHFQDLRSEMILTMERLGIEIEVQHHEVATAGQAEIDMKFDTLLVMADKLMLYKYVVKNVARAAGFTATFMPKPLFQDNGSGMHCHQSLWKDGNPLFYGEGYGGLSDMGRWYIGGLLKHARAVLAFAAPTTNSYKRLVPGYEAPVNLVYSQRNRSAACRIPLYSQSPKAKRVEFRCPDPSCNPYLAFSAMLMAGLDGVQNRIEPPDPVDKDLYDLPPEELSKVPQVPGSLDEALAALEADHDFLKAGGVFTDDLLETWIDYKRLNEVDAIRLRPHPWEFMLYYDI